MAASVYKGLTIQIGADTTRLDKALRSATKSAEGTYKQLRQVNSALKESPDNVELLAQKQTLLNKQIEAATNKLEVLREAKKQLDEQGLDHDSAEWTQLVTDISRTESSLENYKGQLKEANRQQQLIESGARAAGEKIEQIGDKAERAGSKIKDAGDKIQGFSGGVERIGGALTAGITAPIIAAGTAAVMSATNIDSGLASVKKTVDGTAEQYQALKDTAIEFSKTNAVSAQQMLELDALGAQLGFGIDELELFGRVASGLDIATNMDAETAASEMAQFANITRMAHGDIEKYGSAIVNIGNNMATTESKVSEMSQRIAAAGTQTKMSQADILGWAGAMSSLGIEAEAGGTAFSTTISTIDAAVARGGKKLDTFAKIAGKSSENFAKSWKENSTQAFQDLLSGVDSAENMTIALEEMGVTGIRQSDVLKRLAGNTDLVSKALGYANEGWEQNAALQTEVDNRNGSLSAKFEMLKNRVTAVAEQVGSPLAEALLDAVDAAEPLIEIVQDGAEAFSNMSEEEQQNILNNIAMVASLGPLLTVAGKVGGVFGGVVKGIGGATSAVGSFVKTLGQAKATTGTMSTALGGLKGGLIGLGVAAAAVAAGFALKAWADYRDKIEKTEKAAMSFKDMEENVRGELDKNKGSLQDAGDGLKTYQGNINDTISKIDELRDSQVEANDKFMDSFKDFAVDEEMLGTYLETIRELGNSSIPLTAEQQAQLNIAVQGYNEITGDSLEIIDAQTGKLSKNTDEVIANTNAYLKQAEIEVYQERIKEAIKERIQAEENLTSAQDKLKRAQEYQNELMKHAAEYGESYAYVLSAATAETAKCEQAVKDAEDGLRNANNTIKDGTDRIADLTLKEQEAKGITEQLTQKFGEFKDETKRAIEESGLSVADFAQKLADAGVGTQTLKNMSAESFQKMYEECNGDTQKIIDKLVELDRQTIGTKTVPVDESPIDRAIAKWGELRALLDQPLQGKAMVKFGSGVGVVKGPFNAAGGIAIPRHADGGILAHPTLTSVGWVGEAGAEAIIPLTNPKYVGEFARTVAQFIGTDAASVTKIINFIFDNATLNDDAAMRDAGLTLLEEVQRKAAMNLG